mmetsp:Transcript_52344/g.168664  ORF Transcript_52344/g.168664 Transcript_52344/m.168664 type:complete len:201 (-) Transcript_52344:524-1126(-)
MRDGGLVTGRTHSSSSAAKRGGPDLSVCILCSSQHLRTPASVVSPLPLPTALATGLCLHPLFLQSISARLPQSFLRFRFPPRWPPAGGHCPAATTRFMRAAVAWSPAASNASPSVLATQPRFSLAHARGPSTGGSRYGTVPAVRLKAGSDVQHHEERSDCSCRGQLAARCSSPAAKPPKDASGSSRWRTLASSEPSAATT